MTAMPAMAGEWYVQLNAGGTVATDSEATVSFTPEDTDFDPVVGTLDGDLDEGLAFGAAAGYAVGNGLRLEGEVLHTRNDVPDGASIGLDDLEFRHTAVFANVLYDIPMEGPVQPYVGAGIGFGSAIFDQDSEQYEETGTAWQVRVGANYPVNETLTLDLGYRYVDMADWDASVGDLDLPDDSPDAGPGVAAIKFESEAHVLTVGIRLRLGNTAY